MSAFFVSILTSLNPNNFHICGMLKFCNLLLVIVVLMACSNKKTLFEQLPVSTTSIDFNNTIIESDSINVMDFENVYNGGGVGAGDFNNDGLEDLY